MIDRTLSGEFTCPHVIVIAVLFAGALVLKCLGTCRTDRRTITLITQSTCKHGIMRNCSSNNHFSKWTVDHVLRIIIMVTELRCNSKKEKRERNKAAIWSPE